MGTVDFLRTYPSSPLFIPEFAAGVGFSTDTTTVAQLPKPAFGTPEYEGDYCHKHKIHLKKALTATPLLGGGFCSWQRELKGGSVHDVNMYQSSKLRERASMFIQVKTELGDYRLR